MMTDNDYLKETQLTFAQLGIDFPPVDFLEQCEAANYRPSTALDALKEFSILQGVAGESLRVKWDLIMDYTSYLARNKRGALLSFGDEIYVDNILLGYFPPSVLEDDSSVNLIKIRLCDNES